MVLEDQYFLIVSITAKEGQNQFRVTEDQFHDPQYHALYDPSKRGNSMLTQLSKLTTFVSFEMQQASETGRSSYLIHLSLH